VLHMGLVLSISRLMRHTPVEKGRRQLARLTHCASAFPVVGSVVSVAYALVLATAGFAVLPAGSGVGDMAVVLIAASAGLALLAVMCIGRASTFGVAPVASEEAEARGTPSLTPARFPGNSMVTPLLVGVQIARTESQEMRSRRSRS
jgi:hypothetical protein